MTATIEAGAVTRATFDAAQFARAWLSVAHASGKDDALPVIARTIAIESYLHGVRLVATDRYVLLRSWVPNTDTGIDDEPGIDELPDLTVIAADVDGRARNLLAYLLKQADDEDVETLHVRLILDETDYDPDAPTFDGMDRLCVVIDYPGRERLRLPTRDGEFPDWRNIVDKFVAQRTTQIALNPDVVGRLAKLGKLHDNAPLLWNFGGEHKAALFEVRNSDPALTGVFMPVRLGGES